MPVHALQDQRIITAAYRHGLQRHTPLARPDGTALRAVPSCSSRDALDGEKARRTAGDRVAHAADAGEQRHALVGDRSGGSAGTAKRVQNPSFARRENLLVGSVVNSASRPQGRWSPPTGGRRTDRDALQAGTAARKERMHPQPSQRDRREWRDDPTRANTSGRSHHVTVEAVRDAAHGVPIEGHGHSPPIRSRTGARCQTRTGTHSHSRTWRLLPSWLLCPSCLHTQPLLRRHSQG